MNNPLLAVEHLSVSFNHRQTVVDDISFEIYAGETFALVGESGSGKSITAMPVAPERGLTLPSPAQAGIQSRAETRARPALAHNLPVTPHSRRVTGKYQVVGAGVEQATLAIAHAQWAPARKSINGGTPRRLPANVPRPFGGSSPVPSMRARKSRRTGRGLPPEQEPEEKKQGRQSRYRRSDRNRDLPSQDSRIAIRLASQAYAAAVPNDQIGVECPRKMVDGSTLSSSDKVIVPPP